MGSVDHSANGTSEVHSMQAYVSTSLFQPHNARQALRDAHEGRIPPLLGVYYGISSVPACRFIAPMGFDFAWIDWEHTSCNVETMTTMVHDTMLMSQGKTLPFVRIPGHDHAAVGYALDAGASIVVPQIENVEQCKHVLSAAKFGAKQRGTRSAPPFRLIPQLTDIPQHGDDIHKSLNHQAAVMIQIETLEGINNLDEILTECPDVDAVWLGNLDARISMNLRGNYGMGGDEPEWQDAVAKYEKVMKKHNKPLASFALSPDMIKKKGETFSFLAIDADVMKLASMFEGLQDSKDLLKEVKRA
ncbi:Pyruvate/Phosphoenolpyruvate kinase-like domain-containing protein [Xylariaceae sp. FL0016]|nr:Pyruvate/Phosphoenolpyruvate kinase-like domain-containing protein [Xylariaceae sp. FL0016]